MDPTFNLKTGADSDLYFAREITQRGNTLGKIKTKDGVYKYPFLTRSTGNSIKGTTESITSNELRKGRTKSAPKQGNTSATGNLDIEFSALTYDDLLEAVFRGEWTRWTDDTASKSNLDNNSFATGYFATACSTSGSRRLIKSATETTGDDIGLIDVPAGSIVHELTCGTKDIKYSILRHFGGVENEDVYQEFKRMAVGSMDLSVAIGEIITGSFGFSGVSDPKMCNDTEIKTEFGGTSTSRFADGVTTGDNYIKNLPSKSTQTDQFTAREGCMYISGKKIEYSSSLDMSLDNGLTQKSAIFVKNPISTTPLSLDITGTVKTYLISEESTEEFNKAVANDDVEILYWFQDKEVNPEYVYVFQIFKAKFTDHDASVSGADTLEVSFPFQSFGERAIRCFRITLPKVEDVAPVIDSDGVSINSIAITPSVEVQQADITGNMTITGNWNGTAFSSTNPTIDTDPSSKTYKQIITGFGSTADISSEDVKFDVSITWGSKTFSKSFTIEKKV